MRAILLVCLMTLMSMGATASSVAVGDDGALTITPHVEQAGAWQVMWAASSTVTANCESAYIEFPGGAGKSLDCVALAEGVGFIKVPFSDFGVDWNCGSQFCHYENQNPGGASILGISGIELCVTPASLTSDETRPQGTFAVCVERKVGEYDGQTSEQYCAFMLTHQGRVGGCLDIACNDPLQGRDCLDDIREGLGESRRQLVDGVVAHVDDPSVMGCATLTVSHSTGSTSLYKACGRSSALVGADSADVTAITCTPDALRQGTVCHNYKRA